MYSAHNKKNNLPVVVQRHAFLLTYKMISKGREQIRKLLTYCIRKAS